MRRGRPTTPLRASKPPTEPIWGKASLQAREFRVRYQRAGLGLWNTARVSALCHRLKWTPWMLCAWAGMFRMGYRESVGEYELVLDTNRIEGCWENNTWPVPVTVQFSNLEAFLDSAPAPQAVAFAQARNNEGHSHG